VNILAAEQTPDNAGWFQGTSDAVKQSMRHLVNQDYDYILILSGDQLYQMDLEEMLNNHIAQGAELTIATIPVVAKEATSFGIMKVNKKGRIEKFIEKPKAELLPEWESPVSKEDAKKKKIYLASMGIYIFNKETLKSLFAENADATDFGKEIIPAAITSGLPVSSYQYSGYWTDIGNISSFFEANLELTDNLPKFNLFDEQSRIFTRARMLPPAKFTATRLTKAVISEGAILHAKSLERCIVGVRSRIGKNTSFKNVIMMGADYYEHLDELLKTNHVGMGVGNNCHVEMAIIDKNCRIGHDVVIKGKEGLTNVETESYCIVDGIVVVKKGATIANGTRIGDV
jgi:glucose-1-phosphate adenylyltransferase